MLNLPNALTLLRFVLVPIIGLQLLGGNHGLACALFLVSALSDWADGMIARHWNQRTRFGAVADPLADKLTMLTVTLLLAFQQALPWWFALAVVLRDAVIVAGALAFHLLIRPVEMTPSRLSKFNTVLEFLLLVTVLAIRADYLPDGPWRAALLAATLGTIVLSGGHYIYVWGRKAAAARQPTHPEGRSA